MTNSSTRLMLQVLTVVMAFFVAIPAYATHTPAHAADQIGIIAVQAQQDMDSIVSAYADEIAGLQTIGQVLVAEADADDAVIAIWADAKKAIEDIVQLYPSLGSVGGKAKQQLLKKRAEALAAIDDLTAGWAPGGTTTTTTTATTTTTTAEVTTTTRPGNSPSTTANPGHGTTTSTPGSVTTTTIAQTSTTTVASSGVLPPPRGGGGGHGQTPSEPVDSGSTPLGIAEATVLAQTSSQMPSYDTVELWNGSGSSDNDVTEQMSTVLETVLPPAAVEVVLSPLLVLEILIRTSLFGGQGILIPLSSLAVCALLIYLTDRFSKRTPATSEHVAGGVV